MGQLNKWAFSIRKLLFSKRTTDNLDDEILFHLEMSIEHKIKAGIDPDNARRAARKEFGNIDRAKEECRDSWGTRLVFDFWRDLKSGFLQLNKSKAHAAIGIATLAISIGASTSVYSLVDKILLSELAIPNPSELHTLYWTGENVRLRSSSNNYSKVDGNRQTADSVSYPMFLSLRDSGSEMANILAFDNLDDTTLQIGDHAIAQNGQLVSDNFFETLQVKAFAGRLFESGDSDKGAQNIVITHNFWKTHLDATPSTIGSSIRIYGRDFTIIGILPESFPGIRQGEQRTFYVPITSDTPFLTIDITSDVHWGFYTMARIKSGARASQLEQVLSTTFANGVALVDNPAILVEPSPGGLRFDDREYRKPLSFMLGVVGAVLLVACLNLAGLSVASSAARKHEMSVRAALGASRLRLVCQSLTENLSLSVIGGLLGVFIANWGTKALSRMLAGDPGGLQYDFSIDQNVIVFALVLTILTTLISGLLPALRAGSVDPLEGLKSRGSHGANRQRLGKVLVVIQVFASIVLLVVASLYARSFINLQNIDTGFNHENLLIFSLNPGAAGYDKERRIQYYRRAQEDLRNTPGIDEATITQYPIFDDSRSLGGFTMSDKPELSSRERQTFRLAVGETFFETMGIPILSGRGFRLTDTEATQFAIVVNESFVRKHTPDSSPIGLTMTMWDNNWTVVGVSSDIKLDNIQHAIEPTTYFSATQLAHGREDSLRSVSFAVRSELPLEQITNLAQQTLSAIDPNIPLHSITTQKRLLQSNTGKENLLATLCASLAVLTLFLSCIGLYGLVAYNVKQRANEIAIRMAIGAPQGEVIWSVLKGSIVLAAIGTALSIPAAYAITQIVKSQLYQVQANDPITFMTIAIGLLAIVIFGSWTPARRAARTDPANALRAN